MKFLLFEQSTINIGCHLLLSYLIAVTHLSAHDGHPPGAKHVIANQAPPATARVTIESTDTHRIIRSNGIPNHGVGMFPNRRNPHTILEQKYTFRVPLKPKVQPKPIPLNRQPWGMAINGVLFDPGTDEYWRGDRQGTWNSEALSGKLNLGLDSNHAHVQPNGAYHYHGLPTALWKSISRGKPGMHLLGWAADGFPIYGPYAYTEAKNRQSPLRKMKSSYSIKQGNRVNGPGGTFDGTFTADYVYTPGKGDLDKCGGGHGVTPEFPEGTYYYVLTEDYPFIPRMFKGQPDTSFQRRMGGPGMRNGARPRGRRGNRSPNFKRPRPVRPSR
jgi:hypothetical protein